MLREVKPRNARTARIVKAREPQLLEERKRVLILHGSKCPEPVNKVLKTFHTLTKPDSVLLNKKNQDIHPFDNSESLEFLAGKNDCGLVVFGSHSKKRPNNITLLRIYDGKILDIAELLSLSDTSKVDENKLSIGLEMKPMILFAGSMWDDASVSAQASLFKTIKSMFLDLFQGEEITSIDVAGLQYILIIAAGESQSAKVDDLSNKPVIHLRWFKIRTMRSNSPKLPRVELDPIGPSFDFALGRHREADSNVLKEALKHGRRPNEARTKKNIDTDAIGDKVGRVHLGRQDLNTLQTRKMKGLKRSRDDLEETATNGTDLNDVEDKISEDEDEDLGGMDIDGLDEDDGNSSPGETGDELSIGSNDETDGDDEQNELPKRQRTG